ncbi:hypothetical protein ACVWW9_001230 [Agrococcus sp. UYP33]
MNRVITALLGTTTSKTAIRHRWLSAVASHVVSARPDIAPELLGVLGVEHVGEDVLAGLTIGEIGVCYEALLSGLSREDRKSSGQFFTPDDAARFMARQSADFADGVWLDPCCGVGNLSWHLARERPNPGEFVRDKLVLVDRDPTALKSAVTLIAAEYVNVDDGDAVWALASRAVHRDFLSEAPLPDHDFAIFNPPYARAEPKHSYETAETRDLFAYFMERIAKSSRGFIAVTPASYLAAPKFQSVRDVLRRTARGGQVFVFDNVPDTLFRGYKFGSSNTSKTNFVRAAVTVCAPDNVKWTVTPILRWQVSARANMFEQCSQLLGPVRIGPHGEWAKLGPGLATLWDDLVSAETATLGDFVTSTATPFRLDVALTPRYFISATYRVLERGSKTTLYFATAEDRDRAAIVLNSSLPYLWWRVLDGGVTLPRRVLLSTPIPAHVAPKAAITARLRSSEQENLVVKLNAGRENQNVKHPRDLVEALDEVVMPGKHDLRLLYANSMFPLNGLESDS